MKPLSFIVRIVLVSLCAFVASKSLTARAQTYTWDGGGADNNWSTGGNWIGDVAPVRGNSTFVTFTGSTRTSPYNNQGDWQQIAGMTFASGASGFTIQGNNIGFVNGSGLQVITQNSAVTQEISAVFSFASGQDSQINLNGGDLLISAPNMYIDSAVAVRSVTVTGTDTTRRTITFAGNVNKSFSGADPDLYIHNNKRALVTGSLTFGAGNDGSIFITNGVLQFSGAGTMTGGRPVIGYGSGTDSAAVFLDTAGTTFARQLELNNGSQRRTIGGLNTSGTVTFSGDFAGAASNYDLAAATGGAAVFSGVRNFNGGLYVNRPEGASAYGGTVILSGTTSSNEFTAIHAGTLQFSDFNQLGSAHFEFNADSGDSGTLRYAGGSTTTTKTLWIDNTGITRAAIDVSQAGTTLTWNPGSGAVNQNLTKTGAGGLQFGLGISGAATVGVESGTLTLTGNNSYSGGTTVSGGRIVGTTSSLQGAIVNNAAVTFDQATTGNYGGTMSGSGSLTKIGVGTVRITGSSSYSGGTVVSNGVVEVSGGGVAGGNAAGLGTGLVSVASGAQVRYWLTGSGSRTIANAFSLAGGTLHTEDGSNTYVGPVTLASGASTISAQYEDPITLSGGLAGSGNVLFTQAGSTGSWAAPTYVLSGTGANTGTVRVTGSSGGAVTKLQLANVNALQSATLDLATGDVGTVEFTVAGNNTYALGGLQGGRNLAFGANSLSVGGNGQSTTYSGNLSGSGSMTKAGNGTLILSGTTANNYSGGTVVSSGTVQVSASGTAAGGNALALGTGSVSIASGAQVTYWLSESGSHTIANSFSLSGGALHTADGFNTFSGRVTLASGASTISSHWEDTITLSGGLAGSGNVLFTQAGGGTDKAAPTYILSGTGAGTGTVRVSGSSGGAVTKLQLANVNALQSATLDLATGDVGAVEFTVAGNNTYALGGLQGSRDLAFGANSLSVGGNGQSTTYSGGLSGSGGLTKSGTGAVTLTGSSSHTGGTTVAAGRLVVNGRLGGNALVEAAATLGGSGTVAGNVTVAGTHSPGNSPGVQTVGGNLTYDAGSAMLWELTANTTSNSPVVYDQVLVGGNLTFSGSTTLALSFADAGSTVDWSDAFWDMNHSWTVYDLSTGTTSGLLNLVIGGSLLDSQGDALSPTRGAFATALDGQDVILQFSAVPEPSTLALAVTTALAAAGWGFLHRRPHRRLPAARCAGGRGTRLDCVARSPLF